MGTTELTAALVAEIRAEMVRQHVTQRRLADHVGISPQYMSGLLNGSKHLRVAHIASIAEMLHLSAADLTARAEKALALREAA